MAPEGKWSALPQPRVVLGRFRYRPSEPDRILFNYGDLLLIEATTDQ